MGVLIINVLIYEEEERKQVLLSTIGNTMGCYCPDYVASLLHLIWDLFSTCM